jgi:hypothetical protein
MADFLPEPAEVFFLEDNVAGGDKYAGTQDLGGFLGIRVLKDNS